MKRIVYEEIIPMFDKVLITYETYDDDVVSEGGIIDVRKKKGDPKEYQTVLAAGPHAQVQPGDMVQVNFLRYAIPLKNPNSINAYGDKIKDNVTLQYDFSDNEFTVNNKKCLLINGADIVFKFKGHEEEYTPPHARPSQIIHRTPTILDVNGNKINK